MNRILYFFVSLRLFNKKCQLPPGSFRVLKKGYEEVRYIFKVHVFTQQAKCE